jgi:hypothetical protein
MVPLAGIPSAWVKLTVLFVVALTARLEGCTSVAVSVPDAENVSAEMATFSSIVISPKDFVRNV